MTDQLTIQFVGICAFIKQPGGKILVVLPDASTGLVDELKPHLAFVRWERKDVDGASDLKADEKESNEKYGVVVLKNDTLRIDGPIKPGPLVVKQSFVEQIPPMEDLAKSSPQTSRGIAASITLDRGDLEAEPIEQGHVWVFKRYGDTNVNDAEWRTAREFSNTVLLRLEVDTRSKEPLRIVTGQGALLVPASATGVVQITIGNLEGSLLPVEGDSDRPPQDVDFLYQYEIASKPLPVPERLIPTRGSKIDKGKKVACLAARWGAIEAGVQS